MDFKISPQICMEFEDLVASPEGLNLSCFRPVFSRDACASYVSSAGWIAQQERHLALPTGRRASQFGLGQAV